MNYSTNYNLNKPERSEQFNIDHWNNNTDAIDTQMHTNEVNIAQNATDIATLFTGLNTKNTSDTNSVFYKLMKLIYPVGSLYWSANSTDPSTLFGGTWTQIKDKFVLACGDTYSTVGATGGASSVTLTVNNLPSHNHSIGGSTGNTQPTFAGTAGTTGKTQPTFTGTAVNTGKESAHESFSGSASHSHNIIHGNHTSYKLAYHYGSAGGHQGMRFNAGTTITTNDDGFIVTDSQTVSISGTCTGDHTHSVTASGTVSNHDHSFTPSGTVSSHSHSLPANTGNKGSGTAFSIMPPYIVKYCWQRTA